MADLATVDLNGLHLVTDIGTYGPDDVVPDVHVLDLSLRIDPAQVLVPSDVCWISPRTDPLGGEFFTEN